MNTTDLRIDRDVGTMRDRQRERLDGYLCGCLRDIERATDKEDQRLSRGYLVGAVLGAQTMDVLSAEEAQAWIDRAWEASK